MADLKFRCEKCSQKLGVSEALIGKTIKCPGCASKITIAAAAPAPSSEAAENADIEVIVALKEKLVSQQAELDAVKASLSEAQERVRKAMAMPTIPSTPGTPNGLVRQNTALQRRVDALNMELDEKSRALMAAERRSRELEEEVAFLKQSAELQKNARNSINSFIQNVERNESVSITEPLNTPNRAN